MLQIRPAQFDTLDRNARSQFEDEMVRHLRAFAPAHAGAASEDALRGLIQFGIVRARQYGFTVRGAVRFYLELMVMFGHSFDIDPLLPWAVLDLRTGRGSELARADRLHDAVTTYRKQVIGANYEVEHAAVRRLISTSVAVWLSADFSEPGVAARLREVYPEKCRAAGSAGVEAVVARGRALAREHQLARITGGAVFAALLTAFGNGCVTDPLFPWIADNLRQTAGQPGEARVEKLATRALAILSAGLANIQNG